MAIEVFSVKLQPTLVMCNTGELSAGTEIIIEFRRNTLEHQFALSRVPWVVKNDHVMRKLHGERFILRANEWL